MPHKHKFSYPKRGIKYGRKYKYYLKVGTGLKAKKLKRPKFIKFKVEINIPFPRIRGGITTITTGAVKVERKGINFKSILTRLAKTLIEKYRDVGKIKEIYEADFSF